MICFCCRCFSTNVTCKRSFAYNNGNKFELFNYSLYYTNCDAYLYGRAYVRSNNKRDGISSHMSYKQTSFHVHVHVCDATNCIFSQIVVHNNYMCMVLLNDVHSYVLCNLFHEQMHSDKCYIGRVLCYD